MSLSSHMWLPFTIRDRSLGKNVLHHHVGFYWERIKPIWIPPNFYLLLPCHYQKPLFGKSTFCAQKETDRTFFIFVSLLKKVSWGGRKHMLSVYVQAYLFEDILHFCLVDIFKIASLGIT